MESRVVTPDDVLQLLMNDGTVDSIRMKVLSQLKANEEMKRDTMIMVEQSRVLNTPGAEKQSKRDLFDALRKELETPVLEKASKAVWELIISSDGLGKEITDTVDRAYCRLTGLAAPPPAVPAPSTNQDPDEQNESKKGSSVQAPSTNQETEEQNESKRKRSFGEAELGEEERGGNENGNGKRHLGREEEFGESGGEESNERSV